LGNAGYFGRDPRVLHVRSSSYSMSSRDFIVLGAFLLRFTPNYRSTGAGGTFTPQAFSHNLMLRPVCLLPGPGVLWS
jgi:hypothetical protein